MAAGALKGQTEKSCSHRLHPIGDVFHAILFLDTAAFAFLLMQAIEGRRQNLLIRRIRQHVTSELPGDEFVIR